ncbi:MAG: hypothetical protein E7466_02920 [Ruminococcaceae bacterium]|nr:hypothetical protein [Oscillospiraceae bacterium]MBQ3215043.1 hypothetical protein [Oscillospiraceae bacterium]
MEKKNDIEFDLIELLLYMKKRIWIVALTVVLFAAGGYFSSKLMTTPEYTARAQLYIRYDVERIDGNTVQDNYTEQLLASQLRNDCVVLLKSRDITGQVLDNLELPGSAAGLSSRLIIEPEENTHILNISIVDTNPQNAARILNEVCAVGKTEIAKFVGVDVIQVVDPAEVPGAPSSPSPSRNATVAAILGFVAAVSIMIIVFLMDDSIRNEYDMEHYLGLSTLAEIPVSSELNLSQKGMDNRGRFRRSRK